jgi:LysR family transcriptional regulator of abg operon
LKPPRVAVTSESFPALLELIVGTDLVTILPLQLLRHRLVRDFVHAVPIEEDLRSTAMALVRRAGVPLTPVANALAQEFRRLSRRYAQPDNRS